MSMKIERPKRPRRRAEHALELAVVPAGNMSYLEYRQRAGGRNGAGRGGRDRGSGMDPIRLLEAYRASRFEAVTDEVTRRACTRDRVVLLTVGLSVSVTMQKQSGAAGYYARSTSHEGIKTAGMSNRYSRCFGSIKISDAVALNHVLHHCDDQIPAMRPAPGGRSRLQTCNLVGMSHARSLAMTHEVPACITYEMIEGSDTGMYEFTPLEPRRWGEWQDAVYDLQGRKQRDSIRHAVETGAITWYGTRCTRGTR